MNKTFDFKRFGSYLAYDLRNAWNNAGLTLVICAAMPFFVFCVYEIMSLVIVGEVRDFSMWVRLTTIFTMLFVCSISIPTRLYGRITDKRYGTDWLLVPASMPEKFISMLLVLCLVVPVVFTIVCLAVDTILGLAFSGTYGPMLFSYDCSVFFGAPIDDSDVGMNFLNATIALWVADVLAFTLGAVFFRKSKIVKTFLVLFALQMLFSVAFTLIFGMNFNFNDNVFDQYSDLTFKQLLDACNLIYNLVYFVQFAVLVVLLYLRLKTIKH